MAFRNGFVCRLSPTELRSRLHFQYSTLVKKFRIARGPAELSGSLLSSAGGRGAEPPDSSIRAQIRFATLAIEHYPNNRVTEILRANRD
jgi:hypothetical protein